MCKVLLTVTESKCRSGYVKKAKCFDAVCPDESRVHIHGEVIE